MPGNNLASALLMVADIKSMKEAVTSKIKAKFKQISKLEKVKEEEYDKTAFKHKQLVKPQEQKEKEAKAMKIFYD